MPARSLGCCLVALACLTRQRLPLMAVGENPVHALTLIVASSKLAFTPEGGLRNAALKLRGPGTVNLRLCLYPLSLYLRCRCASETLSLTPDEPFPGPVIAAGVAPPGGFHPPAVE
jgi:hypothetical protein